MGLLDILEDLAVNNILAFTLLVVGVAVFITIILLMSYFNILVTIASFSYPNARLRAMGNPFINKARLTELLESTGVQEAASEISKEGYDLPPNIEKIGVLEAERQLELAQIKFLKKVIASDPESVKPFLNALLLKYDAMQVKTALRSANNGTSAEELKQRLIPVKEISQEVIDNLLEAGNVDDVINALRSTRFGEMLAKTHAEYKGDIVALDLVLDQFFSKELHLSITRVDTPVRETITLYIGRYVDVNNLKHIIRSKIQGLDVDTTQRFLLEGGRSLAPWKLRQLAEVKGLTELTTELEGTPYLDTIKQAITEYSETKSIYSLEVALDRLMLKYASEISGKALIAAGPTIRYLVAKEYEIRNIKAVLRGLYERVPSERIMPLLIMED